MASANLSVLVGKNFACIKIAGRANFASSPDFKTLLSELAQKGFRHFIIDLGECVLMDSTFLGVLAGAALEVRRQNPPGSLVLCRVARRNLELLRNLGLHRLLIVDAGDFPMEVGQGAAPLSGAGVPGSVERARLILEAHENLVAADPSNQDRFQDVLAFLRNRIEQNSHGPFAVGNG